MHNSEKLESSSDLDDQPRKYEDKSSPDVSPDIDFHKPRHNDIASHSVSSESASTPKLQRRLLTPLLLKKVPPVPTDDERKEFPRYLNPYVWTFFTWLWPLLRVGYKRTLEPNDFYKLNEDNQVQTMADRFQRIFAVKLAEDKEDFLNQRIKNRGETLATTSVPREVELSEYTPSSTLCFRAFFATFRNQYTFSCICMALALAVSTCNPLLSKHLIQYVQEKAIIYDLPAGKGVGYALGVSAMVLVGGLLANQGFYLSMITGAHIRGVCTKVLMDKSFKLSAKGRKQFPPSKITSIMSTDVSRIDLGVGFSPWLFVFPVPVAISIGILVHNLKAPAMVGVGIMFAFLFFAAGLGMMLFVFRTEATKLTDIRVGYMKEVLTNLKMIKFYSWEIPYFGKIKKTRKREMNYLLKMEVTRSVIISVASSLTLISSFAAFMVLYATASPSKRNPAAIFSSVALFNLLALAFIVLPLSIAGATDAFLGMVRVGSLLAAEEFEPDLERETTLEEQLLLQDRKLALEVKNASFEWEVFDLEVEEDEKDLKKDLSKEEKKEKKKETKARKKRAKLKRQGLLKEEPVEKLAAFELKEVDFAIRQGEFVAITGSIGCGKTSLLLAIEGLMKRNSGSVKINGSFVMCGVPWIQNSTLRDNILFNAPYDETWYKKVVYACCLQSDIDMLPAGDRTEIGERGITLSGGQKARVSLARAVYANTDIILLDDVLSAVDSKVGKHIIDECVLGILKDKTRILATHQLSLIGSANRVMYFNSDNSISIGTMESLQDTNSGFKELMEFGQRKAMDEEEKEEEEEQDPLARELTTRSAFSEKSLSDPNSGKLITEEFKNVNAIGWETHRQYFGAGATGYKFAWNIPVALMGTILSVFLNIFTNTWLSFWVEYKFKGRGDGFYIAIYAVLTFLAVVSMVAQFSGLIYIMNRAARILNIRAAEKILHVPMSYMDVTPMGRIINRFTKDTDALDNEMGDKIAMITYFFCSICGILILCIIYFPWFAIAIPFIVFIFAAVVNFYQASGREIKRVEAIQRSHVYNNFNETLTGMDTIKGYDKSLAFLNKNVHLIDRMNEAYYITVANQRWLDVNLTFLGTAFALLIAFLCVFRVFKISPASVGLLLSYVLDIAGMVSMLVVVFTEVEQEMNSAERIIEYAYHAPQEASYIISETCPPPLWPQEGQIHFENASLAYRPGLPLVLKNFNADIKPHEKIGICGRTGAGKSSIMVALYRIVELSGGKIEIDGIDIKTLGLNNLRSKLSIIPQDPVLFRGSIRSNLDPFDERTDDELWDILTRTRIIEQSEIEFVKLQSKDSKDLHKFHLDREVEDDGGNFSLGERQLIAFARALVRGSKILILDEATSSVDYATDSKIQEAIVKEFADCTIMCIAHRLKTILNYDRILVMDYGEIKEFDTPWNLFNSRKSIFRQMCEKSKILSLDFARR